MSQNKTPEGTIKDFRKLKEAFGEGLDEESLHPATVRMRPRGGKKSLTEDQDSTTGKPKTPRSSGRGKSQIPATAVKPDTGVEPPGTTTKATVTTAVTAITEKEEPMPMITTTAKTTPAPARTQQDMESCPVCGYRKPVEITVRGTKVRPLVCKGCSDRYHQYGSEVATKLANLADGETVEVLTRHAWILSQLDLERFANELNEAFQNKERLNQLVAEKIRAHGQLPPEVFRPLRDKLQLETGASAAYGKWRRLQERLKAATEVRPQVEKMVAEAAAKNSPGDETQAKAAMTPEAETTSVPADA